MDIGTGITIGCAIIGTVAVLFKIFEYKKACNGNGNGKYCAEHSGVMQSLKNIEQNQSRHEGWLKDISKDIKALVRGTE